MNKRISAFGLAVCLLCVALVLPARADEPDDSAIVVNQVSLNYPEEVYYLACGGDVRALALESFAYAFYGRFSTVEADIAWRYDEFDNMTPGRSNIIGDISLPLGYSFEGEALTVESLVIVYEPDAPSTETIILCTTGFAEKQVLPLGMSQDALQAYFDRYMHTFAVFLTDQQAEILLDLTWDISLVDVNTVGDYYPCRISLPPYLSIENSILSYAGVHVIDPDEVDLRSFQSNMSYIAEWIKPITEPELWVSINDGGYMLCDPDWYGFLETAYNSGQYYSLWINCYKLPVDAVYSFEVRYENGGLSVNRVQVTVSAEGINRDIIEGDRTGGDRGEANPPPAIDVATLNPSPDSDDVTILSTDSNDGSLISVTDSGGGTLIPATDPGDGTLIPATDLDDEKLIPATDPDDEALIPATDPGNGGGIISTVGGGSNLPDATTFSAAALPPATHMETQITEVAAQVQPEMTSIGEESLTAEQALVTQAAQNADPAASPPDAPLPKEEAITATSIQPLASLSAAASAASAWPTGAIAGALALGTAGIFIGTLFGRKRKTVVLFLSAAVLAAGMFALCYRVDNKYTAPGPRAVDGVVPLTEEVLSQSPVVHLTQDWAIYRGKLLTPADFATDPPAPDETVFLGQYGGFEGRDQTRSPHGSATYRLRLALPAGERSYTLELPEIYSAYRLYINGEYLAGMGDPEPLGYQPVTGNSSVTVRAADSMEILVAVTDFSHFYSGMVYPPAFGATEAVSRLLIARNTVRTAACAIALFIGLMYLGIGLASRRGGGKTDLLSLLYGLLCLCFSVSIGYPLLKTLYPGGIGWYSIENFAYCAILLLVLLIQRRLSGFGWKIAKVFPLLGVFVCCCALFIPHVIGGSLPLMMAYSGLIELYTWSCAFYLTAASAWGMVKNMVYSKMLLAGMAVFDCALVMDRLFPLFEPIRFGWFIEMAGAVLVILVGVITAQNNLQTAREKLALEGKIAGIESLVSMQQSYYPVILEGVEEARRARHDLRHHLSVIGGFVSAGKYQELERYLGEYSVGMNSMSPLNYCENYIVDVILRHFAALAAQEGVEFIVDAQIPTTLAASDADICNLISNLLENALEACAYVTAKKRISITVKQIHSQLVFLVDNSYDGTVKMRDGQFLSRKRKGEGIGLSSVRAVAEKYGGALKCEAKGNLFMASVYVKMGETAVVEA